MGSVNQNLTRKPSASSSSILKKQTQGVTLMGHIQVRKMGYSCQTSEVVPARMVYPPNMCWAVLFRDATGGHQDTAGLQQRDAGLESASPASEQDQVVPTQHCFAAITSVLPCSNITFNASPFYFNDLS